MVLAIIVAGVLWARPEEIKIWAVLIITIGFAAVGFVDDYKKITRRNNAGLSGKLRLVLEFALASLVIGYLVYSGEIATAVTVPFIKSHSIDLSWGYVAFGAFVIVAFANAVNLTDGLDGLAITPIMTSMTAMGILAYIAGNTVYADYLHIPYVEGAGELVILSVAVVGAGLGFLWFNTFPASIFMGDTGSLPLGGLLGAMAVVTRNEFAAVLLGGIFVMEAFSVVIQVVGFKLTGKRVFKMAPFHHHLELSGWDEPKIIVRFWIISILLAAMALLTLKLR
jgi:phospho-N-acetylmuramoyl-pentapeptide-transferase